jgi:hypothetical protein
LPRAQGCEAKSLTHFASKKKYSHQRNRKKKDSFFECSLNFSNCFIFEMTSRLNPKLTKRNLASSLPVGHTDSSGGGGDISVLSFSAFSSNPDGTSSCPSLSHRSDDMLVNKNDYFPPLLSARASSGSEVSSTEVSSESTAETSLELSEANDLPKVNPRLHLIHNGRWIPKEVR